MKSVMKHSFAAVPGPSIQRSVFNRSHGYKTTFDGGDLVPFYVDEVLPGDSFKMTAHHFARMATPIAPVMDNAKLDFFYFFVPYRLIWDNFQKFMGEQKNPGDTTDYLTPVFDHAPNLNADTKKLLNYMGYLSSDGSAFNAGNYSLPKGVNSALARCYNLIYNEWFRDQNLQDSLEVPTDDGPDDPSLFKVVKRGKRHDYFTSALPWPQKGDAISFDLAGTFGSIDTSIVSSGTAPTFMHPLSGTSVSFRLDENIPSDFNDHVVGAKFIARRSSPLGNPTDRPLVFGETGLKLESGAVSLADNVAITVNQLRESFQLQRMLERDARGGTRYTEIILSHFGVRSPDARLQRPEYLGGGSSYINVNPVTQQSSTDDVTPQGNLAAFATTSGKSGFRKSFVEHGFVIGLLSARADLTYQQGLNRMWTRRTRYDFYWPSLAHLGEQPVYNYEIYNEKQGNDLDTELFGYQERYAEYRYKPSLITGLFNSTAAQSLDIWHYSQNFLTKPALNSSFITENPPFKRVSAVPSEPDFILDMYISLRCARPMPTYSVPGLIDHF